MRERKLGLLRSDDRSLRFERASLYRGDALAAYHAEAAEEKRARISLQICPNEGKSLNKRDEGFVLQKSVG